MGKSQYYLGGLYYFTSDEIEIKGKDVYLIKGKHSKGSLPSIGDIKDGLIKMILFTNLEDVRINGERFKPKPVLKLTVENHFSKNRLSSSQKEILKLLRKEANVNNFKILLR